jgi:xanthine dehydrogenase YagR molybdenum-binding subunit
MSLKSAAMKFMQKAVQHAPDAWMPGSTPDRLITHKHGLIGAPLTRIDGPLKVKGAARFAAEFPLPGMLYAAIAFSTTAKGRIASLETAAAEAAPGVKLVMSYKNAPKLKPTPLFNTQPKAAGPSELPIMQDDSIHWNGRAGRLREVVDTLNL